MKSFQILFVTILSFSVFADPAAPDARPGASKSTKPPPPSVNQHSAAQPGPDSTNTFQALQGSWSVTNATMNGRVSRDAVLLEGNCIFKGNELILQSPQKGKGRFTLKMDAKAEPNAFHLTSVEPANAASGWMLFSREAENLRIAFYDNLEGRPESFEPREPHAKPELVVVTLAPKK